MRHWDQIPPEQWVEGTILFRPGEEGIWTVEFDYIGLNGHHYHRSEDKMDFIDFVDLYDELGELDYEFDIEDTPKGST